MAVNLLGRALKTGRTSEVGTLSDWYLTISASIGSRMAMALFSFTTKSLPVTRSLIVCSSDFCAAVPTTNSRALTMLWDQAL